MLRVENAVQLTRGELDAPVSFSYFESLQPSASKVKRGDLFLAFDTTNIDDAVKNGAHGIMYDKDVEDKQDGIAWIRVRDIAKAAFDLLKYELLNHKCEYIVCERIIFEMAQKLIKDDSVFFLDPSKPTLLFSPVQNGNIRAIISFDEKLLQYLSSDEQILFHTPRTHGFTVRKSSVLSSEILWGDVWHVPFPEVLLRHFRGALDLAKHLGILIMPVSVEPCACFEPIFVSKGLYQSEYGKTSQVIIFSRFASNALLKDICEYIASKTSWGERQYIFPLQRSECKPSSAIIMNYGSAQELQHLLEDGTFCYALVADIEKEQVLMQKQLIQLKLFD